MNLDQKIHQILTQNDFTQHTFFQQLRDGRMSKEDFLESQKQFYYAVVGFSSPLALTAARIPNVASRMKIVKNVWEEHGEGDLNLSHGATFQEFMKRLNGSDQEIPLPAPGAAVNLFNSTLNGICSNEDYLVGVSLLGMIERMFADISTFIGSAVVERGWIKTEQMIHYNLHKELDCIHSEDFFSILRPEIGNPDKRALIEHGLEMGSLIFLSLYENLVKTKKL